LRTLIRVAKPLFVARAEISGVLPAAVKSTTATPCAMPAPRDSLVGTMKIVRSLDESRMLFEN